MSRRTTDGFAAPSVYTDKNCRASLAMAADSGQSFRLDMPETAGNICLARRVGKGDRMKRSEIRENIFKLVFCGGISHKQ